MGQVFAMSTVMHQTFMTIKICGMTNKIILVSILAGLSGDSPEWTSGIM